MPDTTTQTTTTTEAPVTTSSDTTHDGTPVGESAPTVQTTDPTKPEPKAEAAGRWQDQLEPGLKDDPSLKDFKDPLAVAKSYVHLRKMTGSMIPKPKPDATPEEKDAFYTQLGWNPDPKTYNIKGPVFPNGMVMKEEEVINFRDRAHKLHMSPEQVQGILDYYGDFAKKVLPDYKGDAEKATVALQEEWGQQVDTRMGVARRALFNDFPKETVAKIELMGLANDVGFIKGMFNRGKGLIEEGIIPEEIGQGVDSKSAQSQINEIMGNQAHPYFDKAHPAHEDAVKKVNGLYKVLYA